MLGLLAGCDDSLHDLDAGHWRGKAITAIAPPDIEAWIGDPHFAGHGGESVVTLIARVGSFLAARLTQGNLVAVTHGAVLRAAFVSVLDASASAFWRIDAPPLTILTLSSDTRRWSLRSFAPPAVKATGE